jgi:hypothetical protein
MNVSDFCAWPASIDARGRRLALLDWSFFHLPSCDSSMAVRNVVFELSSESSRCRITS